MLNESWRWSGQFRLALINRVTGQERAVEVRNMITDAGLNWLRDRMQGLSDDFFTEIGVGTDGRDTQPLDTQLYAEISRKPLLPSQPETGVSLCDAFWDDSEANVQIREVAIFAGPIMVARAVVDVPKTSLESLTITRRDTLKRTSTGG